MIVDVKTQHNSTFTYCSWYDTIGKCVGYCTIFEMIIVIISNHKYCIFLRRNATRVDPMLHLTSLGTTTCVCCAAFDDVR